eukprot:9382890-Heterocapsa_arctica.AAC.1
MAERQRGDQTAAQMVLMLTARGLERGRLLGCVVGGRRRRPGMDGSPSVVSSAEQPPVLVARGRRCGC